MYVTVNGKTVQRTLLESDEYALKSEKFKVTTIFYFAYRCMMQAHKMLKTAQPKRGIWDIR